MAEIRASWVFGKAKEVSDAEQERGEARFGTLFHEAIYEDAYAEAATVLFDHATRQGRLSELAQPILYLQRHTLELVLKDALRGLHQIRRARSLDADLFGGDLVPEISGKERKTLASSHDLGCLMRLVTRNLQLLGFADLPPSFGQAVDIFGKFEQDDPSRFRYPLTTEEKRSFATETIVPVKALQECLVNIVRECEVREEVVGEETFAEKFHDELIHEGQIDHQRIEHLTNQTVNGELNWRRVPAMAWTTLNDDLGNYSIVTNDEHIVASTTDGRKLVLFPLDGDDVHRFAIAVVRASDAASPDRNTQLSSVLILDRADGYLVRQAAIAAGVLDANGDPIPKNSAPPADDS
jgi:hypothetical protein